MIIVNVIPWLKTICRFLIGEQQAYLLKTLNGHGVGFTKLQGYPTEVYP